MSIKQKDIRVEQLASDRIRMKIDIPWVDADGRQHTRKCFGTGPNEKEAKANMMAEVHKATQEIAVRMANIFGQEKKLGRDVPDPRIDALVDKALEQLQEDRESDDKKVTADSAVEDVQVKGEPVPGEGESPEDMDFTEFPSAFLAMDYVDLRRLAKFNGVNTRGKLGKKKRILYVLTELCKEKDTTPEMLIKSTKTDVE